MVDIPITGKVAVLIIQRESYTPEQIAENREIWAQALESGQFIQGKHYLKYQHNNGDEKDMLRYCCLGVGCEIMGLPDEKRYYIDMAIYAFTESGMSVFVSYISPPKSFCDAVGLGPDQHDEAFDLNVSVMADANDSGMVSFNQFARVLRGEDILPIIPQPV